MNGARHPREQRLRPQPGQGAPGPIADTGHRIAQGLEQGRGARPERAVGEALAAVHLQERVAEPSPHRARAPARVVGERRVDRDAHAELAARPQLLVGVERREVVQHVVHAGDAESERVSLGLYCVFGSTNWPGYARADEKISQ